MEFKNIRVREENGIGEIVFDRPPLNVLNIEMMTEINMALKDFAQRPELKVVVITGTGKSFSAGVDVAEHTKEKVNEMISVFHEIFHNLNQIKVPTIAAVNGAALGGGCEVAIFCDIVIASEKAKFGQPEIKVGVLPPIAAIMLPRLMDRKKALELILTGDVITASEAKTLGLVNQVIPVEEFDEKKNEFIQKFTALSGAVLKITKKSINQTIGLDYSNAIKSVEDVYLNELMSTDDANEGLQAFMEKREPIWKNK
ncbi:enoyl-CoA hydratase/isomerase family protein [[Eubacterium] cellulosolvens]